ncbi:MAG: hypothetical protein P9M15_01810 [Candidatus Electryoneaceae bacterium]|nr:hypothetical protein [Candidatus Electryoneaceae bacterium]
MKYAQPIGSKTQHPAGFFMAANAEELREVAEVWSDFGIQALAMASRLTKTSKRDMMSQVDIELGEALEAYDA